IKSSQVSRRHCELLEVGGKLVVRDLGSSNGTFVNGKRVLGQQPLKPGDELTVGAVTLRVVPLGRQDASPQVAPASKPGDTAVVDPAPIEAEAEDEDEFEIAFDEADAPTNLDVTPRAAQDQATPAPKPAAAGAAKAPAAQPAAKPAAKSTQEE